MNKKQFFLILTSIFMVMTLSSLTVFANSSIKVSVDNKILSFDSEPFIEKGTTLVPMRKIFEALNADVKWVNETQQIIATDKNNNYIVLTIGSTVAQRNGTNVNLLVAPKVVNGSTFVPARFIAEALNADVVWDSASQTVIINSSKDKGSQQVVFNDYVPYSTSDLATLAKNILNGDVVYSNGQYWATPQFANIIANEEVVYENDISAGAGTKTDDEFGFGKVEIIIVEQPENETSIDGIVPPKEDEEKKAIDDKVEQFKTEWIGENELKNSYKVTITQLHNAILFHRYENSENVTLYTINNPPASLKSEKVYKIDGVEFQYIKDSEISKRYGQGIYFKRSDLKREGVIK